LCLSDINPRAIAAIKRTIALNGLEDQVSVYLSDALEAIPKHERWDLVVSNPPHFDRQQSGEWGLLINDPDWSIHKRFYAQVRCYLNPNGQCFIQENYEGSCESTFVPFLEGSGLEYIGSLMVNQHLNPPLLGSNDFPLNSFYFFVTRVKHDEFVWGESSSAVDVEVVIEGSTYRILVDQIEAATPLRLPVGRKYRIALSNNRDQIVTLTISWDSRSAPFEVAAESVVKGRRVFVPTAPTEIADAKTGNVIVAFE